MEEGKISNRKTTAEKKQQVFEKSNQVRANK